MKQMPLTEHLEELRTRLVRSIVIIVVSCFICYGISDILSEILLQPLRSSIGTSGKIVYLSVLDKILAQFQLSLWAAFLLSSPLWFREVWLFIRPGLYDNEAKIIRPFLFVGFILFWLGVLFTYYIIMPFTIDALVDFGVQDIEAMISFKEYITLSIKVLVVMGLVFQLPNILLILGFMEIVTMYTLRNFRRYVYVVLAVISAVVTPPDVLTMMMMWVPLVILYEIGILAVALIVHPYLKKKYS